MRTITREISLEPMTSRLPSVWPAYHDGRLYLFDARSLKDREWEFTSNYGMVPANVLVESRYIPDDSPLNDGYGKTNNCWENFRCLSFENVSKLYAFFVRYYEMLTNGGACDRVYRNAVEYYRNEYGKKADSEMAYGGAYETYAGIDEEFRKMGGSVRFKVFNKENSTETEVPASTYVPDESTIVTDAYDDGLFGFICEAVVPTFKIPMSYRGHWKTDRLFYPDVIKWLSWFTDKVTEYEDYYRKGKDGEVDTWECGESDDCCECEEYFRRGGKRIFDEMKRWFRSVQSSIIDEEEIAECLKPRMILPVELQGSLEDSGMYSIFSNEYEPDSRYGSGTSMTVVTIDGEPLIRISGNTETSKFDSTLMERYVSVCNDTKCKYKGVFYGKCPKCGGTNVSTFGWESYTDKYISEHNDEFEVTVPKSYTYDEDGRIVRGDSPGEIKRALDKKFQGVVREGGWYFIDGTLYPVKSAEYGEYDLSNKYLSGRTYIVLRDDKTNTPYTFVNGKVVYADYYQPTNEFYFPFFRNEGDTSQTCSGKTFNIGNYKTFDRETLGDLTDYLSVMGKTYIPQKENGVFKDMDIGSIVSPHVSSYAVMDDGTYLYHLTNGGSKNVFSGNPLIEADANEYSYFGGVFTKEYVGEIKEFKVTEITGRTSSKLHDLKVLETLTDDIGNHIDGIYVPDRNNTVNHQPPEGMVLEPLYQVGNTAHVERFSITETDPFKTGVTKNHFIGDIIKEMVFYYKSSSGEVVKDTKVSVKLGVAGEITIVKKDGDPITINYDDWSKSVKYTSLSAITFSTEKKESMEGGLEAVFEEGIYCDITYNVGATLERKSGKALKLPTAFGDYDNGVEYRETVKFIKDAVEYYVKKPSPNSETIPSQRNTVAARSVSYPVYVYRLEQQYEAVENQQNGTFSSVAMADFKATVNMFRISGEGLPIEETYSRMNGMARHNNMAVYPLFAEEYRMGTAAPESVEADIYIDRGINAAFERHLKLGEVTSMEALEQYGLSYFNICS